MARNIGITIEQLPRADFYRLPHPPGQLCLILRMGARVPQLYCDFFYPLKGENGPQTEPHFRFR
jgi:hypothetical protein